MHNLDNLPPGCRAGHNDNAFRGGFLMWENVDCGTRYIARSSKTCPSGEDRLGSSPLFIPLGF